jgi:parallel beta-helix repeat protein
MLLLVLNPFLMGRKPCVSAAPDVIHVPTDYPTIQEAINKANPGDTIFVHKGIYERAIVNKSVSIVGEDRDSTIIDGNGTGTVLHVNVNNVKIQGFTIRNGGTQLHNSGILIDGAFSNNITDNKIINTKYGVYLSYSGNSLIYDNEITSNYFDGVSVDHSTNNRIQSNNITFNLFNGVLLSSSGGNIIHGNNMSSNLYGISLYYSSDNRIAANTISYNFDKGIHVVTNSSNNSIYHNNFYLNKNYNVQSDGSTNAWDYVGEGNYWSDYAGQDPDGDGIGNTPYPINLNNQDNYPLMRMVAVFSIPWQDKSYSVTIISNSTIADFAFEVGAETGNRIIRFRTLDSIGTIGFSRVAISTELMPYPYIVLINDEEVTPILLNITSEAYVRLYFTYLHNSTVTIISSETLRLYYELLDKYNKLQNDLYTLNLTYYNLLSFTAQLQADLDSLNATFYGLLGNYSMLRLDFGSLNATYQALLEDFGRLQQDLDSLNLTYNNLLNYTAQLQRNLDSLNATYLSLLDDYVVLSANYSQLQQNFVALNASYQQLSSLNGTYYYLLSSYSSLFNEHTQLELSFQALNESYQEHLRSYSDGIKNIQNLLYMFAATTTIFIVTTVYLSKNAHSRNKSRINAG